MRVTIPPPRIDAGKSPWMIRIRVLPIKLRRGGTLWGLTAKGWPMDIEDIKLFLEVVFDSSISEAARKSHLSQQTVSRKISQIEKTCRISFKLTAENPRNGVAFPIGNRGICLCTERFARYYSDLGVEDVIILPVKEFTPVVYPFLVYR